MNLKIYGMLDPHTHLRDMEWAHKATFESESRAAIAGGYTAIFDMPNTPPNTTSRANLQTKLDKLDATALCDYGVYFGASQDDNTAEYATLSGVCGLKIFCNATTGNLLIEDKDEQAKHIHAWDTGRVIAVHAEGQTVAQILDIVRTERKHVHFLHISTAEEINLLREAKEQNLPVSVGVCPHHLYMTERDVAALGAYAMMKPELKTQADQDALWQALADGVVDVIESDHAPHTRADKNNAEGRPVYGVPGLETTLPLMVTAVHDGRLKPEQLTTLLAENPRRIFGVARDEGTYTVIDQNAEWIIDSSELHSACGWSPFSGMRVFGAVREVWVRGTQVYDDGRFLVGSGFGVNLFG